MGISREVDTVTERTAVQRLPEIGTVHILLVDDDPQAHALIEIALTDASFEWVMDVAPTARRGMERIRSD